MREGRHRSHQEAGNGREERRLTRIFLRLRILGRLRPSEQQQLFVWAAVVGFLGAGAALLFQLATSGLQRLLTGHGGDVVAAFAAIPPWQRVVVPTVGGAVAGILLMLPRRFLRRRETDYMEAIAIGDGDVPLRSSLARITAALSSIAAGEAIGREGPLVQLAAITGSLAARLQRISPARRRLLVACGAAAGMGAAYHTPLGGALFIGEVVLGSLAMDTLGPLLIASVVSALTVRAVEGAGPLYQYAELAGLDAWTFLLFALLGAACGVGAAIWIRLLQRGRRWFAAVPGPAWVRLGLGGLVVGVLAVWQPEVTGNGATLIRGILAHDYAWRAVLLLLLLKVVATTATFGSGAVGGVFTPSLLIGGSTGFVFGAAAGALWAEAAIDPGGFALIGMGSFMAAAAQAPITAIIMLFEFTLRYEVVLPLMVGAVIAYSTSRALGSEGLYAESLRAGPRGLFDRRIEQVTVREILRQQDHPLRVDARFGQVARAFLGLTRAEQWIVDLDGRLAGGVFLHDIEPFLHNADLAETVFALDILHADVPRLHADDSLPAALERFTHTSYATLPVVDSAECLLGSLAREDLLLVISELAARERTRPLSSLR